MPEMIINASGPQYGLVINPDGSINTIVSGIDITIGSLALSLENVYVTSGNVSIVDEIPTADNKNNPAWKFEYAISGTATGVTGSRIGSIIQFIDAGSFVNVLTYVNNKIVTIGSYS